MRWGRRVIGVRVVVLWAAGLLPAAALVAGLWLLARDDSQDTDEHTLEGAARKVVHCCDGRAADCPAGHPRPAARAVRRVPARW
jgi:hypothetical protein